MRRNRTQSGLTLLEVMITLLISVFLSVVVVRAAGVEMMEQKSIDAQRASVDATAAMEDEITRTLSGALLDPTLTGQSALTGTATSAAASTTSTASGGNGPETYMQSENDGSPAAGSGDPRLTFTTTIPVPITAIDNVTDDWPTQQSEYGPVGGPTEVSFGVTPIGAPPNGETGLFERIQHPSDDDPTQGGTERLIDPDVTAIGFEFWDGQEWDPTWDTTTMTTPQLPEAVQVTYRLKNDTSNVDHMFVVVIQASNVNYNDPVQVTQ